jgi:hypothetical protein
MDEKYIRLKDTINLCRRAQENVVKKVTTENKDLRVKYSLAFEGGYLDDFGKPLMSPGKPRPATSGGNRSLSSAQKQRAPERPQTAGSHNHQHRDRGKFATFSGNPTNSFPQQNSSSHEPSASMIDVDTEREAEAFHTEHTKKEYTEKELNKHMKNIMEKRKRRGKGPQRGLADFTDDKIADSVRNIKTQLIHKT